MSAFFRVPKLESIKGFHESSRQVFMPRARSEIRHAPGAENVGAGCPMNACGAGVVWRACAWYRVRVRAARFPD